MSDRFAPVGRWRWVGSMISCCLLFTVGCANISGGYPRDNSLIPGASIKVSPHQTISLEGLVQAAATAYLFYVIVDPLAPNWHIEEAKLSEEHYLLSLRMKPVISGGDGEARQVLARRAEQIARERGYSGYQLLKYSEGIESGLLARRRGEGLIELVKGM